MFLNVLCKLQHMSLSYCRGKNVKSLCETTRIHHQMAEIRFSVINNKTDRAQSRDKQTSWFLGELLLNVSLSHKFDHVAYSAVAKSSNGELRNYFSSVSKKASKGQDSFRLDFAFVRLSTNTNVLVLNQQRFYHRVHFESYAFLLFHADQAFTHKSIEPVLMRWYFVWFHKTLEFNNDPSTD